MTPASCEGLFGVLRAEEKERLLFFFPYAERYFRPLANI